jgi:hypothetical protein
MLIVYNSYIKDCGLLFCRYVAVILSNSYKYAERWQEENDSEKYLCLGRYSIRELCHKMLRLSTSDS